MPLMGEVSREWKGKCWVERRERDRQRTLRQDSNSGRRTNHKAIGAEFCFPCFMLN